MLKKFEQRTKLIKTIYTFLKKKPSLKFSWGHVEYRNYNRKSYARCPKLTENFFFKKFSSKCLYRDEKMQFIQPGRKKLAGWANFFLSKSAKELKTSVSFWKIFSIEVFLWTRRLHYWQPHWKKLTKKPKYFRSVSEKERRNLILFSGKNIFQIVPVNA